MIELFFKECKYIAKSSVYLIFIIVIALFLFSNYFSHINTEINKARSNERYSVLRKPVYVENIDDYIKINKEAPYGMSHSNKPEDIIKNFSYHLYYECKNNNYATYPFGIIHEVTLDDKKQQKVINILYDITGKTIKELDELNIQDVDQMGRITDLKGMEFSEFKDNMEKVCGIVGKKSFYDVDDAYNGIVTQRSYEGAVSEYKTLMEDDRLSNAFARYFCDFAGIIGAVFPVFLVIYLFTKDKKCKMNELIYTKGFSSNRFIIIRFLALFSMSLIPFIILSTIATFQLKGALAFNSSVNYDYFAFIKYVLWWVAPTVAISVSLSMLITILTDSFLAVVIQIFITFFSLMSTPIIGSSNITSILIRFNSYSNRNIYLENFSIININRCVYCILSILVLMACIIIFELKRKGKIDNIFKRCKSIS